MSTSLDTHIQDVLNVIEWEDLENVVLCGHSYGGMVITGVADKIPHCVAALVYLDAFIPEDGDSTMDMLSPERQLSILKGAATLGGDAAPAPSPEFFGINEADREWVRSKMTPQPLASIVQAIHLTGAHMQVKNRVAIFAEGPASAAAFYEKFRSNPLWKVQHIKGGHDVMIDQPEAVAQILCDAARVG
jgi:pimeloyl-ACP methyl ester carboxylesterase